jgi:hypothetical protein
MLSVGVNFALWAGLFAAAIIFLGRSRRQIFGAGGWWILLPIVLSSLAFLWHESPALKVLNLLALLTALSLAMLRAQGGRLGAINNRGALAPAAPGQRVERAFRP